MDVKRFFVCAASVGLLFFNGRLSAAVESDIVGYKTIEATSKYTLIGVPFQPLVEGSADTGCISVHDLVSGVFSHNDQIQILTPSKGYVVAAWNAEQGFWSKPFLGKPTATKSDATVEYGKGVWLVLANASPDTPVKVSVAGTVDLLPVVKHDVGSGYTIMSFPFPMDLSVQSNAMTCEGLVSGDQIQVRVGENYTIAMWNDEKQMWSKPFLGKPSNTPSELVVPAGEAFWFVSKSPSSRVTFSYVK